MGNLKFGNNTPLALYMGVSGATKAYYGTEVVFGGEPTPIDYSKEYLTLDILTGGTIVFSTNNQYLRNSFGYSINNGEWQTAITEKTEPPSISVDKGDKVRIKCIPTRLESQKLGTGTAYFNVYGNFMSLLYGDDFVNKELTSGNTSLGVFAWSDKIVSAEHLILPSNVVSDCYYGMFLGCKSLTTAPALPATTLATNCYREMFRLCSSLTVAPALPATTLADNCYQNMFSNCTSLTAAPELPATTLATCCYQYMFLDCTSLTAAPELPATTLASSCYNGMFQGCSSLNYVKCLATNISASNCINNWLSNVAATGTFEGYSSTGYPSGASGIPSGWTFVEAS